jgi:hypothetical protein
MRAMFSLILVCSSHMRKMQRQATSVRRQRVLGHNVSACFGCIVVDVHAGRWTGSATRWRPHRLKRPYMASNRYRKPGRP